MPTDAPTATPTVYKYPYLIRASAHTMGDNGIYTVKRRRGEMSVQLRWDPIPGAWAYRLEMRTARPEVLQNITDLAAKQAATAAAQSLLTNISATTASNASAALIARRRQTLGKPEPSVFPGVGESQLWSMRWSVSSAAADSFQVLWYRDKNRPAETRCITVDDIVSNAIDVPLPSLETVECDKFGWPKTEASHNVTCASPPPCARFDDQTFTLSPFALMPPEKRAALKQRMQHGTPWQEIVSVCDLDAESRYNLLFTTTCRVERSGLVCDWTRPSPATLIRTSCTGKIIELPLRNSRVQLSPVGCVQHNLFQPSSELCRDRTLVPVGCNDCLGWSTWTCVLDEYKENCLEVDTNRAELSKLSTCEHLDRFVIVPVACLDSDCSERLRVRGEQVIEFEFLHDAGLPADECLVKLADSATASSVPPACGRAKACLGTPSKAALTAGIAATAVVGGTIVASAGASAGGAMTGGTVGSSSGVSAVMGSVQFVAMTSNTCVLQSQQKFTNFMAMISSFEIFNLRISVPEFIKEWFGFLKHFTVCGQPAVDLTQQARADIGDIFAGNVIFGFLLLSLLFVVHFLLLQIDTTTWRKMMIERYVLFTLIDRSIDRFMYRLVC